MDSGFNMLGQFQGDSSLGPEDFQNSLGQEKGWSLIQTGWYYNYDIKDYWVVPSRWRNSICDCESNPDANCSSDHFPLTIDIMTRLKAKSQKRREPRKNRGGQRRGK